MTAGRNVVSTNQNWCTPRVYVEAARDALGGRIALDPCSNPMSLVGAEVAYELPRQDGLTSSWDFESIFVNPPYGSDKERGTTIKHWLARCLDANREYGAQVIALVPVATNTSHWKEFVWGQATAICFLYDTRLKFIVDGDERGKGAPMSCCMVYWGQDFARFDEVFSQFGAVVDLRQLIGRSFGQFHRRQKTLAI